MVPLRYWNSGSQRRDRGPHPEIPFLGGFTDCGDHDGGNVHKRYGSARAQPRSCYGDPDGPGARSGMVATAAIGTR